MMIPILLAVVVGFYYRYRIRKKVGELIGEMDALGMEIEVAIRSGDFSNLDLIVEQTEVIRKSFPFIARFGELKPLRTEFLFHYNQLVAQIDAVYRELEIQNRVNETN